MHSFRLFFLAALGGLFAFVGGVCAQPNFGIERLSTVYYWEASSDLQMVGDYAYVCSGESGFRIMDLTNPANPVEVYFLDRRVDAVCVSSDRAYLWLDGIETIFDVSDPARPVQLGEWTPSYDFGQIFVHGDLGILARYPYGFAVLDVSNPQDIQTLGAVTHEPACPFGLVGNYVCAGGESGLAVWDISNPAAPFKAAVTDTQFIATNGCAVVGNYAYFGTATNGVRIVDLSSPLQPVEVAACDTGYCYDLVVSSDHLIVTKQWDGITIWNVANPASPYLEYSHGEDYFGNVSASGNLVSVGVWSGAQGKPVSVLDISDPNDPTVVGSFGVTGNPNCLAVSGSQGYLGDMVAGLRILDLADLYHVTELGNTYGHSNGPLDIVANGDYVYLAEGCYGLRTFDVSNPAQPESLACWGYFDSSNPAIVTAGLGNLYVTGGGFLPERIYTFSLQNPALPVLTDSIETSGGGDLTVSNGYLYSVGEHILNKYSLDDPTSPQLVGWCNLPSNPTCTAAGLEVVGEYAYVTCGECGLRIFSLAGDNPSPVGQVEGLMRSELSSGHTLITVGETGLDAWDVTSPTQPVQVGHFDESGWTVPMEIAGPYLYVGQPYRFSIYQVDALANAGSPHQATPTDFALYSCYPNPFNATTEIRYDLPKTSRVQLAIFNTLGQRVETLVKETRAAGSYRVEWNAADNASGLYFCRLQAGEFVGTQKMLLIR